MAMASFAHLSREERIGLGVAAVAHVALVAALVLQVQDEPTALPIPERMSVSLADEVSLEATAPNPSPDSQAAVAPVLAPVSAPVVQRRQVVRDRVIPRPTPTPTRQAGGSRMGADFLPGAGASERSNDRGAPAATFGAAERAALEQAISRQLLPHWERNKPQGVDADKLVTVLSWELNPDGTLKGRPQFVSQSGVTPSNRPQAALHVERAIRSVQLAAPFELPSQFYSRWQRIRDWTFEWRL